MHITWRRSIALVGVACLSLVAAGAEGPGSGSGGGTTTASPRRADQAALKPYGGLVGGWRGVGQVERGKTRGAWTEQAEWVWKLTPDSAALTGTISRGKYLKALVIHPGREPQTFSAEATLTDDSTRTFTGKGKDSGPGEDRKPLVLTASPTSGPGLQRITLTPLHDTRLLVLLEALGPDGKSYDRLGEVGYTRQGVAFAVGESGPVCIVTEGRGTIPVTYKGKTYHVCCSGCKDLFNENPEAILAEAAARQKGK